MDLNWEPSNSWQRLTPFPFFDEYLDEVHVAEQCMLLNGVKTFIAIDHRPRLLRIAHTGTI